MEQFIIAVQYVFCERSSGCAQFGAQIVRADSAPMSYGSIITDERI